jgi:hypothetical protein
MFGFGKVTEPSIDRRQSLMGVPVVNPGVRWKEEREGVLLVTIPVRRGGGFLGRFQSASWNKRIRLDPLGSFVLEQIDGKRNALDITDAFIERFKVNRREAELSIVAFLKSLLERHIISIAIHSPGFNENCCAAIPGGGTKSPPNKAS